MNVSFVILFLVAIGLLQWLGREYHLQFDLTQNNRYSLSPASIAAVERLTEPLKITAFASRRGESRRRIREIIERYRKHKPDIQLDFVDPDVSPDRVRAAGIKYDGELLLEYGTAKETLSPASLNEETITNALVRLGHRGERWLAFLSGHGERSPDRQANFDLSTWASKLRQRGFQTRVLALGDHPQIPKNISALVIAGPRTRLLAGEIKEIEKYIKGGGNLLWLSDPGPLHGLEPIAEMLGIEFHPGVIVDPASASLTSSATAIVVAKYGAHPIVRNFADATLFPHAAGISLRAPEGWRGSVLVDTRPTAWVETGSLKGTIQFDKGKDIRGPVNLGVALTRDYDGDNDGKNKREQRIVILGDGDFLSNTFIANAGNLEFGLNLVNWLSMDDAYVNIPRRIARDRNLNLSRTSQITIAAVFLVILPLSMVGTGVFIWLKRRKR